MEKMMENMSDVIQWLALNDVRISFWFDSLKGEFILNARNNEVSIIIPLSNDLRKNNTPEYFYNTIINSINSLKVFQDKFIEDNLELDPKSEIEYSNELFPKSEIEYSNELFWKHL